MRQNDFSVSVSQRMLLNRSKLSSSLQLTFSVCFQASWKSGCNVQRYSIAVKRIPA